MTKINICVFISDKNHQRRIFMKYVSLFIERIGKCRVPEGWEHEREFINIQRLYYIKGGRGRYRAQDGKMHEFEAGKIYIFPYNFYQEFESDPKDRIDHIFIDFVSTPPIIASDALVYDIKENTPLADMVAIFDKLIIERNLIEYSNHPLKFERINDAENGSSLEHKQILYSLIHSLLMLLSREREIPFSSDTLVASTLKHIHRHYSSNISISELAKESGYHVNHFIRRFRTVMGLSPYAYLRNYRIWRAKELIAGGVGITQAAELVGYENASSLSRAIKDTDN